MGKVQSQKIRTQKGTVKRTGRIYSQKQAKEQMLIKPKEDPYLLVRFNPLAMMWILIGFISEIYLIIKYNGTDDPFWPWCVLLVSIGLVGFIGVIALNHFKIEFQYDFLETDLRNKRHIGLYVFLIGFTIFSIEIALYLLGFFVKFTMGIYDTYLYFIAAAIMEELFFRMFLCSLLYLKTRLNRSKILISLITAVPFMLIHLAVYGHSLKLMISMYIGGFLFSYLYLIHKDVSINMFAHTIINIISVILIYQNLTLTV